MFDDPNAITSLGVGSVVVLLILKEVFKFLNGFIMRNKKDSQETTPFMSEKEHSTLCENATLRIEKAFNKSLLKLKDDVFAEFRKLHKAIGSKVDIDNEN